MIKIRQAKEDDFEFLFRLKKKTMKDQLTENFGWDDDYQRKNFFKSMPLKKIKIIILDDEEIGYFLYSEMKKYVTYEYLIIDPSFQNLGIGSSVSNWVFARGDKVQKPVLGGVLKTNEKSKALWLRLGFEIVGETKTHFNLMRKIP